MLRLRREYGGDAWVRRFFKALSSCPTAPPDTRDGARKQSWNWFICASLAAGKDLSPIFVDEWKLPLANSTRAALAQTDWKKEGQNVAAISEQVRPEWRDQ
jgi:hypothetical protein